MPDSFRKLAFCTLGGLVRNLIFFIFFYLYLWFVVDSRFIYHGNGIIENYPVFFRGWAFFNETMLRPGGLVVYISGFLSEFLYYSWSGALVLTALGWGLCVTTGALLEKMGLGRFKVAGFIWPILMLVLYSQYAHYIVTLLALLVSLLFAYFYLRFRPADKRLSLVFFTGLSVVLYAVAAAAYFVFAAVCLFYEIFFYHRWRLGISCLLLAVMVAYVEGVLVFGASIIDTFSELLAFSWKIVNAQNRKGMVLVLGVLCLFVPVSVFLLGVLRTFIKKDAFFAGRSGTSVGRWLLVTIILFALAGTAVYLSYDGELKSLFAVDYYAYQRKWDKLLAASKRCSNSFFVIHAVNRALYHTGRLGSDLFAYPQHPYAIFLADEETNPLAKWKKFDTRIDLGALNLAEMNLTECLERNGQRPMILQRLALINMAKGNLDSARVYLNALSRTLFYSDWANRYLAKLKSDPDLSTDERIQYLRAVMLKKDHGFTVYGHDKVLVDLLEANRQNRMAFEYLMAWYLLSKQLDKIVLNIGRLKEFNYAAIPPLYEEAVLLYIMGRKENVELYGYQISTESRRRVKGFFDIYNRHMGNIRTAFNELAVNYGNSFLFYHLYGISGQQQ